MALSSLSPAIHHPALSQVNKPDTSPASPAKSQIGTLSCARNTVNTIAKKFDINIKLDAKTDIEKVGMRVDILARDMKRLMSGAEKDLGKINLSRQQLTDQMAGNKNLADSLCKISASDVRMKGGKFVPCYTGMAHVMKNAFSSSYKKTLIATKKEFSSTQKNKISDDLLSSDKSLAGRLDGLDAKEQEVNSLLSEIKKDLGKIDDATAFFHNNEQTVKKESERAVQEEIRALAKNGKASAYHAGAFDGFTEIYSTNAGFTAINSALRHNREPVINSGAVIKELERRHGDDIFAKGAKKEKEAIKTTAGRSLQEIKNYLSATYREQVRMAAGNGSYQQLYRGQGITPGAINILKNLHERNVLIAPSSLFSCSLDNNVARKFATPGRNEVALFIEIKGKTGVMMSSSNAVRSEQELAFTPDSKFEILSLVKSAYGHTLTLRELMPSQAQGKPSQAMPY